MQGPPQKYALPSGLPPRYSHSGFSSPQPGPRSACPPGAQLGLGSSLRMAMPGISQHHGFTVTSRSTSTTASRCASTSSPTANASTSTGSSSWSGSRGPTPMPRGGPSAAMPPPSQAVQGVLDRKRSAPPDSRAAATSTVQSVLPSKPKKKKKIADKILTQRVRDLVPESQAYMDLLAFEQKLDTTIMRKRLDIQEALKRPCKQKRKLRVFISNTFYPPKDGEDGDESFSTWELRVEGRLLEDANTAKVTEANKTKRKFSSFFKSLVIELDKNLYGPDNHLVEWHRTPVTQGDRWLSGETCW